MTKRLCMFLCICVISLSQLWAYDFMVDGIYYDKNTDGISVNVTYKDTNYNSYSGDIVIPESTTYNGVTYIVTAIGYEAFKNSIVLTSISIPNCITTIDTYAFYGCSGLKNLIIQEGETKLELGYSYYYYQYGIPCYHDAFYYCPIETLYIGRQLTGYISFRSNTNLKSVVIGNYIQEIIEEQFYGCTNLTTVTIGKDVTSIGKSAFRGCKKLSKLSFEDGILGLSILSNAFTDTAINTFYQGRNIIYSGDVYDGGVVDSSAFNAALRNITELTIGNNVSFIHKYAFVGCSNISSLKIPNSIETINEGAFQGSGLTTIEIHNKIKTIAKSTFMNCKNLTNITIHNGITTIEAQAFKNSGLTEIEIPESVTTIGNNAFYNCSELTGIYITNLEKWCNINFGNESSNPLYYGNKLYLNNTRVRNVEIPDGLVQIKNYTFAGGSGFDSIIIPNSVTSIGTNALYKCSGLTKLIIPNNVTTIGYNAFYGCTGLKTLSIGNGITSIRQTDFSSCTKLAELTLGEGISTIDINAFAECVDLAIINSHNPIPPEIESSSFRDVNKTTCILNIPIASKTSYSETYGWKEFYNINEVDFAGFDNITIDDDVAVTINNGKINVNGIDGNAVIEVYNVSGQLVFRGITTEIPAITSGVYIVKVLDKIFKIAL